MSIFSKNCLDYLKLGFSVIPDKPKSKKPAIKGWTTYCERQPNKEEIQQLSSGALQYTITTTDIKNIFIQNIK